jgi:hypothetical protein
MDIPHLSCLSVMTSSCTHCPWLSLSCGSSSGDRDCMACKAEDVFTENVCEHRSGLRDGQRQNAWFSHFWKTPKSLAQCLIGVDAQHL